MKTKLFLLIAFLVALFSVTSVFADGELVDAIPTVHNDEIPDANSPAPTVATVELQENMQTVGNTDYLNVRRGGGVRYGIIGSLRRGDRVTVLETTSYGWSKITYGNGTGWVYSRKYLVETAGNISLPASPVIDTSQATWKTVIYPGLMNVRTGGGVNYSIIAHLKTGDRVAVFETKGNWSRISIGYRYAWVYAKYIN